ncbi:IS5 family transposase [Nitratireductor sp. ZSWI3]|uniref:IS5 family transposase n=1 Tax=Nitratireductor sp. ZSWI3 TaxID=2966359 RepID=UPI00214F8861|nr:IS5 family transposase [Nitratireductor sp. ZSWI3]MCR4264879.1 IS5 family transposase [Nitratireductor sp. ZSWI3]
MARFDLTDREWALIAPLLPNKPRGVARADDRRVLNGIFYILRTGSPWRDLPERYGPYTTAYNRYNRWAKAGVWLRVFEALAAASPQSMQLIDSSIVRAHQHAAGGKKGGPDHAIGRSRGGLTSKIHVVVDEKGLPVRLALTAGQASDKATAPDLLRALPAAAIVVADRGYDWQHLIDLVSERGGKAHIPTQRDRRVQRSVDPSLYRQRNLVERFFCKLKHFRRVATRYDKLARNFLAAVALASARLWMRAYESTT